MEFDREGMIGGGWDVIDFMKEGRGLDILWEKSVWLFV